MVKPATESVIIVYEIFTAAPPVSLGHCIRPFFQRELDTRGVGGVDGAVQGCAVYVISQLQCDEMICEELL